MRRRESIVLLLMAIPLVISLAYVLFAGARTKPPGPESARWRFWRTIRTEW